ncbi:GNAT family N-acetyltransferase [Vibrio coralliilyticus]|uniref:N-acetyltransferase domain-containing protein n=1 Tax=Vibrio coralliilyticus TaxID=190893 RepID=A0AAN0SER3_9VIBR|nr:GNAT family N-acetyltransferase [Vibrio coralliilyticus]AIW19545.1 hypothetical protein IX92_10930 [Vibrio coralliilyticus]NOH39473.1 GNAT family N-acetyltransferase [Vibrio coralliilyticus]
MKKIHYRNATVKDFKAVVDMFASNLDFGVFTSVKDEETHYHLATIFTANDFFNGNFIKIAEYNGHVCGVLIGSTSMTPDKALAFERETVINKAKAKLQMSASGRKLLCDMNNKQKQANVENHYNCDSELLFFCVDKNYRRNHIGSTLMQSFENFLIEKGAQGYFLYTDTQCSFQYYENNGYQRVRSHLNKFNPRVKHYTYIKTLVTAHNP